MLREEELGIRLLALRRKVRQCWAIRASVSGKKHRVKRQNRENGVETVGQCYLVQSGETVFVAEVWTHIILQQVANWWKKTWRSELMKVKKKTGTHLYFKCRLYKQHFLSHASRYFVAENWRDVLFNVPDFGFSGFTSGDTPVLWRPMFQREYDVLAAANKQQIQDESMTRRHTNPILHDCSPGLLVHLNLLLSGDISNQSICHPLIRLHHPLQELQSVKLSALPGCYPTDLGDMDE